MSRRTDIFLFAVCLALGVKLFSIVAAQSVVKFVAIKYLCIQYNIYYKLFKRAIYRVKMYGVLKVFFGSRCFFFFFSTAANEKDALTLEPPIHFWYYSDSTRYTDYEHESR